MARGDHIRAERTGYSHHGIDCGDGTVIHYSGDHAEKQHAHVRRTSLEEFARGAEVRPVEYTHCVAPSLTITRAESRLGEQRYSLLWNNCEHFARWCKTGLSASEQVKRALRVGAGAGLAAGAVLTTALLSWRRRRRGGLFVLALAGLALMAGCATTKPGDAEEPAADEAATTGALSERARELVEKDPNNPELHYKLGNALFDEARYGQAADAYEKAVELKPDYAAAYCNLGLCLRFVGDLTGAIEAYSKALESEPGDSVTLQNLLVALRMTGQPEAALQTMTKLAELQPNDVQIRSELAHAFFQLEHYEAAAEAFKEVIRLDPGLADDYYNLGLCYYYLDDLDTALTTWLTAMVHNPRNPAIRRGMATLYWRRGEYDRAWDAVKQCQTIGVAVDPAFISQLQEDSGQLGPE